jgi:hypothetical protein
MDNVQKRNIYTGYALLFWGCATLCASNLLRSMNSNCIQIYFRFLGHLNISGLLCMRECRYIAEIRSKWSKFSLFKLV